MTRADAPAKLNLALVVGATGDDGLHEVATILQRIDLVDTIELEPGAALHVEGFAEDSLVRAALQALAAAAGVEPDWRVRLEKRIPVAAGLGGGSSDAATAFQLANATLDRPLTTDRLRDLARTLGADVPFFLAPGPQLGTGDGSTLAPLDLPQDYTVLLLLPAGAAKESTGAVYGSFEGAAGFAARRDLVLDVSHRARHARDLADLPPNDLATSPLSATLLAAGAFRADVSGAGPTLYALFETRDQAERAATDLAALGQVWIAQPAW